MSTQTSQKKVVSRNVAIALGIICIILAVGLVGTFAYYTMGINIGTSTSGGWENRYNDYVATHSHSNDEWNALQYEYKNYKDNHLHTNSEYVSLQDQVTSLQNQVDDLTRTLNLEKTTTWVNDQTVSQVTNWYTSWTGSTNYAGYVSVNVQSSTTSNTYVRVIWSSYGVSYDKQIGVGSGGTAIFPVLPTSNVEIRVGNTNLLNGATETVTITYHY